MMTLQEFKASPEWQLMETKIFNMISEANEGLIMIEANSARGGQVMAGKIIALREIIALPAELFENEAPKAELPEKSQGTSIIGNPKSRHHGII